MINSEKNIKSKPEKNNNKKSKPLIGRLFYLLLFVVLLPLIILGSIIKSIYKLSKYCRWKKTHQSGEDLLLSTRISHIDLMEGYEFEHFLKTLFFYLGYDAHETPKRGDYGADLLLSKGGVTSVVQAKRYSKNVGMRSVQEVTLARTHYKTNEAMVITNALFTPQAEQLARENSVQLIDRNELEEMLDEVSELLGHSRKPVSVYIDDDESNIYRI